eukprot:m.636977 g.636977  ORF g.636977 m.636977 type:complete len:75 (-) comp22600_c0_seq10:206-430(-)
MYEYIHGCHESVSKRPFGSVTQLFRQCNYCWQSPARPRYLLAFMLSDTAWTLSMNTLSLAGSCDGCMPCPRLAM